MKESTTGTQLQFCSSSIYYQMSIFYLSLKFQVDSLRSKEVTTVKPVLRGHPREGQKVAA